MCIYRVKIALVWTLRKYLYIYDIITMSDYRLSSTLQTPYVSALIKRCALYYNKGE